MEKIRILYVDDHNIVRKCIGALIEENPKYVIVAEAEDGQKLIQKYVHHKPDIVITDISMPRMNGMEGVKNILTKDSSAKILFLTVNTSDNYIAHSIKLGVLGLVGKDITRGELYTAIDEVAAGRQYFLGKSDAELKKIINKFNSNSFGPDFDKYDILTHREKEVVNCIAEGFTSEEIAQKLILSKRVIDAARSSIMKKLGINNLHQLIKFSVECAYHFKMENQKYENNLVR